MKIIISENINGRILEREFNEIKEVESSILGGGLNITTMFNDKLFIEIDSENGDTWKVVD